MWSEIKSARQTKKEVYRLNTPIFLSPPRYSDRLCKICFTSAALFHWCCYTLFTYLVALPPFCYENINQKPNKSADLLSVCLFVYPLKDNPPMIH